MCWLKRFLGKPTNNTNSIREDRSSHHAMAAVPAVVQMITRDSQEESRDRVFMTQQVMDLIDSWDQAPDSDYTIVSIIGPQSSGKSTLLNKIFQAHFTVMGSNRIRNITTRGIWVTVSNHPRAIVIDTEGADGIEQQDDISFENQSALLALLISDVVFINLWENEINRSHAGFMTTLALMFKEMTNHEPRKTKIVFAVRDYDDEGTYSEYKDYFNTRVHEIWSRIHQTETGNVVLTDYVEIYVELFPSAKHKLQEFEDKCKSLCCLLAGGEFRHHMPNLLPARRFPTSAACLWESILRNERLHIPSHMVVMSRQSCESVMREKLRILESVLFPQTTGGSIPCPKCFLVALQNSISHILSQYEHETSSYDNDIANETKERLKASIIELNRPAFQRTLEVEKEKFLVMAKKDISEKIFYKLRPTTFVELHIQEYTHRFDRSIADLDYYHDQIRRQENIFFEQLTHFAEQKATEIVDARQTFFKHVGIGAAGIVAGVAVGYALFFVVKVGVPAAVSFLPKALEALKARECWMFISTIVEKAINSNREAIVAGFVHIFQRIFGVAPSTAELLVIMMFATWSHLDNQVSRIVPAMA